MDGQHADLDELDATARALQSLVTAFDSEDTEVSDLTPSLGSGEIASALHSFATNWNDSKKKLVEHLGDLQGMVTSFTGNFRSEDAASAGVSKAGS